ncbi:DUF732 domain-containing protein [Rhodococcus sp. Z13]|uniref:DUF732 domain-containing protein n=1 Tax=Rhodococcus sacchari TaxID=2962047 RepID=A0ACD4DGH7_9NOCA|nr:DUF732 domain-containing protein [Rhodococcus sp. Z13]UYP19185.1 DUF732 domain-containing protein [Rhodococcus sp. Z13]
MPARTRSRSTRVLGALAAGLTAAAVLSACGSDDSTATSTPTSTTAAETSTQTSTTAKAGESTSAAATETKASGESSAQSTPEVPAGVPPVGPEPSPAGQAFLSVLREKGVQPVDEAGAVNIADYICSAKAQGGTDEEIKVFVTALVGSDAAAGGVELTEEEASATADTYITVAGDTYCG